ncbi:ThiJ/PfpI [Gymnopilus junonius]|uniref:ThiJ/PfpI n=1 Tax=Gymnopilus junonius TaxID=109634 RepID=A0A9P5TI25_GYMJU|nr:ThiJ/PfpI [Gymnopilus junonius]
MVPAIHFGVLLLPDFQLLDAAGPIDYINTHSNGYLKRVPFAESMADKAPVIEWHFISTDLTPMQPASGPAQVPTNTYDDCPELDYIIIPGPDPTAPLPEGCASFLQKRFADPRLKALLMVCTGSLAAAQTGILDGRQVCSNKYVLRGLAGVGMLDGLKKVKWIGDKRWHVDGKVWSSAGVTSGIDLAAEFARQHFNAEIVKLAKELAEYEPNPAHPDPFGWMLEGVKLD